MSEFHKLHKYMLLKTISEFALAQFETEDMKEHIF